ncbi:MAG TPA: HTTM domain-containing protein [Thermoanaerobaculia bacterium]|nr:HTTM domain-containing protein [Thermoanaerobaculia bacterium]
MSAGRILLAATALWVVLSRFDLPSVLLFPREFWQTVPIERRLRFLLIGSVALERVLWVILHVTLLGAIAGWFTRWSCIISGLLLFHFAPLETIIWTPNPYLRGLTIPCLGLLLFGFRNDEDDSGSALSGWPLRMTQFLLCLIYFFAGYAKLFWSGFAWARGRNMRLYLLGLDQFLGLHTPLAHTLAESDVLCTAIAVAGLVFELMFAVVLVIPKTRRFMIPAAVLFHVANAYLFHVVFQDLPLLLMFANWRWIRRSCRALTLRIPWPHRSFGT